IGFNPLDGFVYGISNTSANGGTDPPLGRVDRQGGVTRLWTFPGLAGHTWVVGTFFKDGPYRIGNLRLPPVMFVVDIRILPGMDPVVCAAGTTDLTGKMSGPSSWAASPVDGKLYGSQPFEHQLSSWDPDNPGVLTLEPLAIPQANVDCADAFLKNNDLI